MKKKVILGLFAMVSVLAFAQTTSNDEQTESIFWGTKCKPVQHVGDGETADLASETRCCYYVLWIPIDCWEQG